METLAYKLTWLSKWKLRCESERGDPDFTKLIGHYSVYLKTAQYLTEQDDSASSDATAVDLDYTTTSSGMDDFAWREGDMYSLPSTLCDDPPAESNLRGGEPRQGEATLRGTKITSSSSVVVSETEIQLAGADEDDDDSDPFSDAETSDFSDDEDTSSDSSVEELEAGDDFQPPKTVCERPRPRLVRRP
ncbi:hypothetical protein PV08_00067 [Exophiala spinifera]|uniref:Uncharacterized protein n=1 Tax=Exophiala spinifera TaxID=91928 RepID=A0A0D2BLR1_9EURO|nr:uncharacterized protein PV08_00067 [Exophiala spinifera]KIW19495.1 hypothetical protein PV08_00067 [Exophiala spinifera]